MLKVVVFNSPPRLGKGEAAKRMIEVTNTDDTFFTAHHREFKDSLFKLVSAMYGISVEQFLEGYDSPCEGSPTGWLKDLDTASIRFVGEAPCDDTDESYSQRGSLIHMSENIIKPVFGKDAFGKAMVASLPESGVVFISDGGFFDELVPVINHVGEDNVFVVRIHRDGVGFEGDSRGYLTDEELNSRYVQFSDVNNNDTLEEFLVDIEKSVFSWTCK
jgi:hypothetical protein